MSSDKPSNVSSKTVDPKSKATNFSCAKLFHCSWTGFLLAGVIVAVGSWAWAQTLVFDENEAGWRLSAADVYDSVRKKYKRGGCFLVTDSDLLECEELDEGSLQDDKIKELVKLIRDHILEEIRDTVNCKDSELTCVARSSEGKFSDILHCENNWERNTNK